MIKLSKSSISNKEVQAVSKVLKKEYLGMGNEVNIFEKELESFFGRPVVCVVNGTSALHLSVQACGLKIGHEVLVPTITYLASFQAITATGAKAIPCDINPNTGFVDINDCKKRITKNTKAIMPVHYSGGVGNFEEVLHFAKQHNLRVIEDAAHAFGTTYKKQRVGSFGDIACFSFDGIKNITSGEGGCIVSADKEIINYVKDARLLGVEKDTEKRYSGTRSWSFDVKNQGWRYHMSNIMAAIGIEQLKRFDSLASKRKKIARLYDSMFEDIPNITFLKRDYDNVVPHIYVIFIKSLKNRDVLRKNMLKLGIETGQHYLPNHLLSFFNKNSNFSFPGADLFYKNSLTLPLHPDIKVKDVQYIVNSILRLTNNEK